MLGISKYMLDYIIYSNYIGITMVFEYSSVLLTFEYLTVQN